MKAISGFLDLIDKVLLAVGSLAVVLVMGIGMAEILGRGIFNAPIRGQIDMIETLMPLIALLALGFNLRDGSHIRMSLLIDKLPERLRYGIEAAGQALGALIGAVLAIGAAEFGARAMRFSDSTPDLRLPTWPVKFLVAFCLALFALRCAIYAVSYLRACFGADFGILPLPATAHEYEGEDARDV